MDDCTRSVNEAAMWAEKHNLSNKQWRIEHRSCNSRWALQCDQEWDYTKLMRCPRKRIQINAIEEQWFYTNWVPIRM